MSACCLRNGRSRGLLAPCTPTAGRSALHPFCDGGETHNPRFLPHDHWGTMESAHTTGRPTGAMKMKKKAGQESSLSCRFFLIFPGCKSIRPAVFHTAQPVARSAGIQFAKTHSFSAKVCVHVTLFHREIVCVKQIAISGNGCRVNDPAGVWGKPPHFSLHSNVTWILPLVVCTFRGF